MIKVSRHLCGAFIITPYLSTKICDVNKMRAGLSKQKLVSSASHFNLSAVKQFRGVLLRLANLFY